LHRLLLLHLWRLYLLLHRLPLRRLRQRLFSKRLYLQQL
jgi:hypothetical protein